MSTFSNTAGPSLTWEPTTDSVYVLGNDGIGFLYNVPTDTWSYLDLNTLPGTNSTFRAYTGRGVPGANQMETVMYDYATGSTLTDEQLVWHDDTTGGPWNVIGQRDNGIDMTWASPILNLGDEYGAFPMAGFQLDGTWGAAQCAYQIYAGDTPYQMELVQSGTVDRIDNRRLTGNKVDRAFVAFVFNITGGVVAGVVLNGVNVYPDGRGK